jgi:hypothetical protein
MAARTVDRDVQPEPAVGVHELGQPPLERWGGRRNVSPVAPEHRLRRGPCQRPSTVMHRSVVLGAQHEQVRPVRSATALPPHDGVHVQPMTTVTAGEAATPPVPAVDRPA